MASSNVYESAGRPAPPESKTTPPSFRYRSKADDPLLQTFDEATKMNRISRSHRRRRKNKGLRRIRHQLKNPEYARKFWTIILSTFAFIVASLILWDRFLR